jgi:hypothetical protein
MQNLNISARNLMAATARAADDDIVRVKDGQVVTARQSFFGRVLSFFPHGAREARARRGETEAISDALLEELKQRFIGTTTTGEGIAEAALRLAGLDPAKRGVTARDTSITVRKIREAHACAKVLSSQAMRSAATLAALAYSPTAPEFVEFARTRARIDPERLSEGQKDHYHYMLQKHIALEPARYLENEGDLRNLAIRTLQSVSLMSDTNIDATQSTVLAQRAATTAILDCLTSGAGTTSLVTNLDRLHAAGNRGVTDTMLRHTSDGIPMTIESLAVERAVAGLTPQRARQAYLEATADDGAGRAVLSALAEQADEWNRQLQGAGASPPHERMRLEVSAKCAAELQRTAHMVLKFLGERGGVEDVAQQLDEASGRGAGRQQAASGAKAAVTELLDRAAVRMAADLRARASRFHTGRQQARQFMLSEHFEDSLRRMGWLDAGGRAGELLLHEMRARIVGPLSRSLSQLEHDGQEPPSTEADWRNLFERALASEAQAVRGALQRHEQVRKVMEPVITALRNSGDREQVKKDACRGSLAALGELAAMPPDSDPLDRKSLELERDQLHSEAESPQLRSWWSHLERRITDLSPREQATDAKEGPAEHTTAARVPGKGTSGAETLLAQWASAIPRGEAQQFVDTLRALMDPQPGVALNADTSPIADIRAALQKSLGVTEGKGVLLPMEDDALRNTLEAADTLPALVGDKLVREVKGPTGEPAPFFGNDFYQDMQRMQMLLDSDGVPTRIGTTPTPDPTEDEKHTARLDGIERLIAFVGDDALAARVSRFLSQKLFAPMSAALDNPDSPIQLADGTRGQILPARGALRRALTVSKTGEGEIRVRVEQDYAARMMATPRFNHDLDSKRSYLRMSFDFSITRDAVTARSAVAYDFRIAQAE